MQTQLLGAVAMTVCLLTCFGCGQTEAQPVLPSEAKPPQTLTLDQKAWEHVPQIQPEDDAILARFLKAQPEWVGSPSMSGTPVLYRCQSDRRFYWLEGNGSSAVWTCLTWEKGKFNITDGTGVPFPQED
ncbi:MAG: hypothetical protein JNM43_16745 [Planctomycetaceae bacterium]|nr:hypothetical protein [Planctomycetaceae bacterium]